MTKPIKIVVAGVGAFGQKHLDAVQTHRRRRSGVGRGATTRTHRRGRAQVWRAARHHGSRRSAGAPGRHCRHPVHADAVACRADAAMPERRQTRAGGDSTGGFARRRAGRRRSREALGARLHGGAHAPLQSLAPVAASAHRRRRDRDPADGRADVLLPAHQHERAGSAAFLDRSPAVASRGAHRRPVPLPDAFGNRARERGAGAYPPGARHRDGHVDPVAGGQWRDLHAVAVIQQRRAAGHVLPLHLRPRHLHRALRRARRRQERRHRCVEGGCVAQRHRAAGPRVLRRHPRAAASRIRAWRRCCRVTARCTNSRSNSDATDTTAIPCRPRGQPAAAAGAHARTRRTQGRAPELHRPAQGRRRRHSRRREACRKSWACKASPTANSAALPGTWTSSTRSAACARFSRTSPCTFTATRATWISRPRGSRSKAGSRSTAASSATTSIS